MESIGKWLDSLGLGRYSQVFVENDIDLEILPELSDADLKELGVSLGHRRKLAVALGALRQGRLQRGKDGASDRVQEPVVAAYGGAAERRQLTVLICDLAGFTALTERLDPEELREILRAYQDSCTSAIEYYGGNVARYMGDGIMAHFGYPRAHEDDAERAVLAGLGVVEATAKVSETVGRKIGVALAVRVGVATGEVVVGDLIGRGAAEESAVIGGTANLADRLQELAEPNSVLIAPATRQLTGGRFHYQDFGRREVKGIAEPIRVWKVTGERPAETRFEAVHGSSLTPLVGRREEVDLLLRRWERAKQGKGHVLLISGEPGIGKSRIAQTLCERISGEDHTRLRFQCSPHHTNSALHPITAQLAAAAQFSAEDSPNEKLEKLEAFLRRSSSDTERDLPFLATLLSLPTLARWSEALQLEPKRQREAMLATLSRQLEGLCARHPVLCIFEDMQWIDPSSLELLGSWVERVRELPVLLAMTFRPEFVPPWTGEAHTTFLTLSRLDRRESAELVTNVASNKKLPTEVLEPIVDKTDGVPLFAEEFTKAVLESGLLRDAGDHYDLSGPLPPLAIPVSLRDSLAARLDRLASVKEVAQIASAIGRTFSHRVLATLSAMSETELRSALGQLMQSELIFQRSTFPETVYEFKHALVQEEAYSSLLKATRRKLHGKIARLLEQQFPETAETQPELIAHHYQEAEETEQAIEYWLKAGQRSARRSDFLEAREQLLNALPLVQKRPPSLTRTRKELDLLIALGAAQAGSGAFSAPESGTAYRRALELCDELGQPPEAFPVLSGAGSFYITRGDYREARRCAEECLTRAEKQGSRIGHVIGRRLRAGTLFLTGELEAARSELKTLLAMLAGEPLGDTQGKDIYALDHKSTALCYLGLTLTSMGLVDDGLKAAKDGLENAEALANPHTINYVACYLAAIHHIREDDQDALAVATRSRDMAVEHGYASWIGISMLVRGEILTRLGRQEEGLAEVLEGLASHRRINALSYLPFALSLKARTLMAIDRPREALEPLDEALDIVGETGETWYLPELYRLQGVILERLKSGQDAEKRLRKALEVAEETSAGLWRMRAAIDLARLVETQGRAHEMVGELESICSNLAECRATPAYREVTAILDGLRA